MPFITGRDTDTWGADATEFRPERWLSMTQRPTNYEHPVFNAGPRLCLGQRMAILEVKVCLVHMVRALTMEVAVGCVAEGRARSAGASGRVWLSTCGPKTRHPAGRIFS